MSFTLTDSGSFKNLESWLNRMSKFEVKSILEAAGSEGVAALAAATPADSRLAANSWTYKAEASRGGARLTWFNTDIENGFPVAIMLQYGYGTGTGGYVAGRDYINPAIKPVFDSIANRVWKAVTA